MIEEVVVLRSLAQNSLFVEVVNNKSCQQCASNSSCGQKTLVDFFSKQTIDLQLAKPEGVTFVEEDQLIIGIEESTITFAAALLYVFPLLMMIMFSGFFFIINSNEFVVIVSAFTGLLLGYYIAKISIHLWLKDSPVTPIFLRKLKQS